MTGDDPDDRISADDDRDAADKAADAAVRRALVESRRQILNFLQRRLGSSEAAEDVLQAFMLRAIERSTQLRDVRSVRGWLSRILATTIVDHQRRSTRRRITGRPRFSLPSCRYCAARSAMAKAGVSGSSASPSSRASEVSIPPSSL